MRGSAISAPGERPEAVASAPRDYLDRFAAACGEAMEAGQPVGEDVRVGPALIRLRFARRALRDAMLPALRHLRAAASSAPPLLTVEMWDAAGGVGLPPPFPQRGPRAPGRGEVRGYGDAGVYAHFQSGVDPRDGRFTAATFFDERAAVARVFVLEPRRIPWHERAAPFRTALQWAFSAPDRVLVHAGAVGVGGHGVLLAGPSGAGKSTTAVAAALAGHDFLGDDYVLIEMAGGEIRAHSLYATAKLHPAATRLLPGLPAEYRRALPADVRKHVVDVGTLAPARLRAGIAVAAIAIPRVSADGGPRVRRASARDALMALAPTTVFQAPRNDGAALRPLASLARRVPAYALDLDGPDGVSAALAEVVREACR